MMTFNTAVLAISFLISLPFEASAATRCPPKATNGYASPKRLKRHAEQMVMEKSGGYTLGGCVVEKRLKTNTVNGFKDHQRCKYCLSTVGGCTHTKYGYLEDFDFPGYRLIATNGIPNHCYNSTLVCENYRAMMVPQYVRVSPDEKQRNGKMKENPIGPVAIFNNGGFLFNDPNIGDGCAVPDHLTVKATLDNCGGRGERENCMYHYYGLPKCWAEANDENRCHLMGFMHDGIPIYGKCRVRFQKSGDKDRLRSCYRLKSKDVFGCFKEDWTFDPKHRKCNLDKANGFFFKENATSMDGKMKFVKGQYGYFFSKEYTGAPLNYAGEKITYGGDIGDFCGLTPRGHFTGSSGSFFQRICQRGSIYHNLYPLQVQNGG